METEEITAATEDYPEAAAILREAGWKPHDEWGVFTRGTLVMGFEPSGLSFHVKNWGRDVHGPDYPDDPSEAAQWLVNRFPAPAPAPAPEVNALSLDSLVFERAEVAPEGEASTPVDEGNSNAEEITPDPQESPFETTDEPGIQGVDEPEGNQPVDAYFTEFEPALEGDDLNLPAIDYVPEDVTPPELAALFDDHAPEPEPERDSGGVAYFGDNIDVIRMAKLGRLGQIARALKATLQEGWTLEEFASLQNKIIRIDQRLDPDEPEARARFNAINERSAAMGRVDAYKGQREGELEALGREQRAEIEAFDPEAGWP